MPSRAPRAIGRRAPRGGCGARRQIPDPQVFAAAGHVAPAEWLPLAACRPMAHGPSALGQRG
eukprot:1670904-Pyramimonas_sp.AAC.1